MKFDDQDGAKTFEGPWTKICKVNNIMNNELLEDLQVSFKATFFFFFNVLIIGLGLLFQIL
jgi:hypothetical protein